jgi:organic radical activating enzyme
MPSKEWSEDKKWNPFNSHKLMSQVYRWRLIERGDPVPQPALITVDPSNICNLGCVWCNAAYTMGKSHEIISRDNLMKLADFLPEWQGSQKWEKGVEAVCIAGGGEPLANKHTGEFIDRLVENGIEVGVVTNGVFVDKFLEPLSKCVWVGVSVDAGRPETLAKVKKKDVFDQVITNIKKLTQYSSEYKTKLSEPAQGNGVSYKYLLYPDNVDEVYEAVKIAKESGCKNFHLRPAGLPWNDIGDKDPVSFDFPQIDSFNNQIEKARSLEDENFGVFGITHKFGDRLEASNKFSVCHAIFMTCVFTPSPSNPDGFNLEVCCDRRGDSNMLLGKGLTSFEDVKNLWGSDNHWKIFDNVIVDKCPRCTYQPHNQIFEHAIQIDNMTYKFI